MTGLGASGSGTGTGLTGAGSGLACTGGIVGRVGGASVATTGTILLLAPALLGLCRLLATRLTPWPDLGITFRMRFELSQSLFRDSQKGFYEVARIFFLLLLNFSACNFLGPA